MITMRLHLTGGHVGSATASWGDELIEAVTRVRPLALLARKLLDAGCPDQEWQVVTDEGPAMCGGSLATLAQMTRLPR